MNYQILPITSLKPYPRNARTHSKQQVKQIAASIKEFGFNNPVLIDDDNQIIAGHGRVEAAKLLKMTQIPTLRLSHLNEAQKRAYILADNKLAEKAGWDSEILAIELQNLIDLGFDIDLTGFEPAETDLILHEASDTSNGEDPVPEIAEGPAISQPGDIWRLGRHVLVCGDSRDPKAYDELMDGSKAAFCLTDPPYNVKIDRNVSGLGKVQHGEFAMASGEMNREQFTGFLSDVFGLMCSHSIDGSIHQVFIDWRHLREMLDAGHCYTELKNVCVWNKSNAGMGTCYRSKHEFVFVWKHGTAPHTNTFELGQHGRHRTNVWDYDGANTFRNGRMDELAMHPTVKPVALVADAIRDFTRRGDLVLDPFCGSGTILIACERTGRRARALEIDPRYVDVAIRRWQALTGKTALLAPLDEPFDEVSEQRLALELNPLS